MRIAKYISLVVGNLARASIHEEMQNRDFSESQMTKSNFFSCRLLRSNDSFRVHWSD